MDARPREPQTKRDSRARSQSPLVVAIDGPSGSGKSSVSRAAARGLNAAYLDTGAMYRALTWWLLERGIDLADADAVAQAAPGCPIRMGMDPLAPTVAVGEVDVGAAIRTERVTSRVSQVAIVPAVRGLMCRWQRELIAEATGRAGAVVAEGRDVTTVVAPDADVRILLTASEDARLARRARQTHGSVDAGAIDATRDLVLERDRVDSTVSEFTSAIDGVTLLDTSHLDFRQSVDAVLAIVENSWGTAGSG